MYTTLHIKQGSSKAFESIYNQYKDKLYFWLLGKMKSEYWAQELVQQTFVKCWISRENLSEDIEIDIQLFRIARSLMIDQLRKLANERKLAVNAPVITTEEAALQQYQAKETRQEIDKVINTLPEVGQQVFRLSRDYGLTYNEIAKELSISPKTVEYHISRTLSQLRKTLAPVFAIFFRF
ncbi:RNA polymerase sigma-70 factor, ECF subfamily [Filimonas lacunae]|uniref:RNA polymerase sigma-70 factor, ECF subfamily n=1 Tax=Filimonas lacunae TaxID=477680 RepID=A0A173MJL4_9BACT|nr:sigma-70 family RNA polymerase sigma factor [Filimonas lacunae]BAV07825.1 RNA polymerase ECF-type sigma factor [Filimonas lacunae]SIT05264.1 RNA polymerase sigma-70 factor, ECF subfamily [Filimonas lacunae]